jgi:hypothetical protein
MDSVSPVLTPAEVPAEQVIALDQPQFFPIVVARIDYTDGTQSEGGIAYTLCRFRLTDVERALIAAGTDLIVGQPGHGQWMPISLQLAMPGEYPAFARFR